MDSRVTLKIYDILGHEVITLVNEEENAGYKEIKFNGANFASGIYKYRLIVIPQGRKADNYVSVKKMMLVK